jgi:hypothetical protein
MILRVARVGLWQACAGTTASSVTGVGRLIPREWPGGDGRSVRLDSGFPHVRCFTSFVCCAPPRSIDHAQRRSHHPTLFMEGTHTYERCFVSNQ